MNFSAAGVNDRDFNRMQQIERIISGLTRSTVVRLLAFSRGTREAGKTPIPSLFTIKPINVLACSTSNEGWNFVPCCKYSASMIKRTLLVLVSDTSRYG